LERGYGCLKFFPAEPAGGVAYLRALAAPLPDARFCPTGGIDAARAPAYLALPNVVCVGGSWVAPRDAVAAEDWPAITRLARAAAALRAAPRTIGAS
ncbi:MAG: keto-deoxy-phosphogluconate aldolase, partial [Geminicoccaceae bacterium]